MKKTKGRAVHLAYFELTEIQLSGLQNYYHYILERNTNPHRPSKKQMIQSQR